MIITSGLLNRACAETEYDAMCARLNPSAETTGATACERCGLCCWQRPPRLTADELTRLAERFGMTPEAFFARHCVVDEVAGTLAPVLTRAHQEHYAGRWLPDTATYSYESPCVFLETDTDGRSTCTVHSIKPLECACLQCWDDHGPYEMRAWKREALIALGWDGEQGGDEWRGEEGEGAW